MAQSNGEFSYKVVVDAKAANKSLADFTKAQLQTTQRVEKSIKRQVASNTKLDQAIIKNRNELAKSRAEFKKHTTGKKQNAQAALEAAAKHEKLSRVLNKQTDLLRRNKDKLRGYNKELERNKRLVLQAADAESCVCAVSLAGGISTGHL